METLRIGGLVTPPRVKVLLLPVERRVLDFLENLSRRLTPETRTHLSNVRRMRRSRLLARTSAKSFSRHTIFFRQFVKHESNEMFFTISRMRSALQPASKACPLLKKSCQTFLTDFENCVSIHHRSSGNDVIATVSVLMLDVSARIKIERDRQSRWSSLVPDCIIPPREKYASDLILNEAVLNSDERRVRKYRSVRRLVSPSRAQALRPQPVIDSGVILATPR